MLPPLTQAQKRMVKIGQQMLEKEKRDKANMREFLSAVRAHDPYRP